MVLIMMIVIYNGEKLPTTGLKKPLIKNRELGNIYGDDNC